MRAEVKLEVVLGAGEGGDIMLSGHFQALGQRFHIPGDDERGDLIGEKVLEDDQPLLAGELAEVAHLDRAQHL